MLSASQQKIEANRKRAEEARRTPPADTVQAIYLDKDVLEGLMQYYGDIGDSYSTIIRKLQQVADDIIKELTTEDQTVLDPLMDHGQIGLSALKLGRKFIGIARDPQRFEIAKNNIEEFCATTKPYDELKLLRSQYT
jgi:DNA modification methylase